MRYDDNGKKIEDFILNKEPFNKSNILITGKNFGWDLQENMHLGLF
ncbi:MAG: hypothetical protein CM1200mP5_3340 [Candidatus Pelagibacterales bacterium]|nr:MAG: hypothetical protein CM1200mP5_3340 [Pelagibacterales bacterium]